MWYTFTRINYNLNNIKCVAYHSEQLTVQRIQIFMKKVEKSVECLKQNKVDGLENQRVIKSKQQAPNLKKIITKAEFSQKQVGVYVLTKDVNYAQAYS